VTDGVDRPACARNLRDFTRAFYSPLFACSCVGVFDVDLTAAPAVFSRSSSMGSVKLDALVMFGVGAGVRVWPKKDGGVGTLAIGWPNAGADTLRCIDDALAAACCVRRTLVAQSCNRSSSPSVWDKCIIFSSKLYLYFSKIQSAQLGCKYCFGH
jgi:hypothetical protein